MFGSDLKSWFRVPVGLARKTRQTLTINLIDCLKKHDFFVIDFKHRKIIYRWKVFFITSMNSRSLPQNKALFGSDQLTIFLFYTKMCADNLSIFYRNIGYHFEKVVEMGLLGPRVVVKLVRGRRSTVVNTRLCHTSIMHHHRHIWASSELGSANSAPSELT